MRRDIIAVDGLQYEDSPVGLARQLGRFPGVLQVDVEPESGIAEITYEEAYISSGQLHDLIEQCGYAVPRGDRLPAYVGS